MWRGVLFVACMALGFTIITPAAYAATAPTPTVKAKLVLDHTTVTAGTTIKGTWIFTNTTGTPILINTCAKDIWDGVGLQSKQVRASTTEPLTPLLLCNPSIELKPGANRFPVEVSTSFEDYGPCYSPSSTTKTPMCHSLSRTGHPPPLPPDKYTTTFTMRGLPADLQLPAPVTVTLRPSRLLPASDGVVIGTAAPCTGVEVYTGLTDRVMAHVRLEHGSKVVGRRLVTDKYGSVQNDQSFMFTEPAGKYVAVGPGGKVPVVIRPGRTTSVEIPNGCF